MLNHSNLEDYADPAIFDLENDDFEPDGPFFLAHAQQVGGPVLELGCGTGRITIPLAQQGVDITGLDIVAGMLDRAKSKAGKLPITWIEADMREFHLGKQFNLICAPGFVFEHLLKRVDQEAMLNCVREHLAPTGIFIIAVRFPHPQHMVTSMDEQEWDTYKDNSECEIRVSGKDYYDPVQQVRQETAYRRWFDDDGNEVTSRARLALRFIFPQEMESLLHYNGFEIHQRFGDWDSSPLTGQSRRIIHICRKMV